MKTLAWLIITCTSILVMMSSHAQETVEFVPSPEQTIAEDFDCEPTAEGEFPSTVIVLPEGEDIPIQSSDLVGPALEQIFNNGPSIGVVMDFCA